MHDLTTIHDMNNESCEHVTGKAQTYAEIRAAAKKELQESQEYLTGDAGYAKVQAEAIRLNAEMDIPKWSEPRNET